MQAGDTKLGCSLDAFLQLGCGAIMKTRSVLAKIHAATSQRAGEMNIILAQAFSFSFLIFLQLVRN